MDVVCAGEVMVEFAPAEGGELYRRGFAGDSFNTAVYLARAGLSTRYLTRLGDDAASADILALMEREGIGAELVGIDPGQSTGLYLIDNDADGERRFSYYRDHSPARRLFDTLPSLNTEVFYFTGITLAITRGGHDNLRALLTRLREQGTRVVFDPNVRPGLWDSLEQARQYCESVLPLCDTILPTLEDDTVLWDIDSMDDSIDFYRERGATEIVVKGPQLRVRAWAFPQQRAQQRVQQRAQQGVRQKVQQATQERAQQGVKQETKQVARQLEQQVEQQSSPVQAVDTTGAGDAFNAGYLARRLAGGGLDESLAAARQLAAEVVQHRGAIMPLPQYPQPATVE